MTFEEAVKLLFCSCGNKKNNLCEVKNTALKLGLLPLGFKAVHIAGTNGKGTTAELLGDILKSAGFKTGVFTSPHLFSPVERIKINGVHIDKKSFAGAVCAINKNKTGALNFFEMLTLCAIYYFTRKEVDIAVFECGIGGLLDSTNIINPALSIITSVNLDHCELLGSSVAEIAAQKAGIIKAGAPVLSGRLGAEAFKTVKDKARTVKAPLYKIEKIKDLKQNFKQLKSSFIFENKKFTTRLMGSLQNQNAAVAIKSAMFLGADAKACQKACAQFSMPWRFEVSKIGRGKYLIKDGAHNPAAFKEFLHSYKQSGFYRPDNTLVFASSKGHDYKTICAMAKAEFNNILLVCPDALRNIAVSELEPYFKGCKVSVLRDICDFDASQLNGNVIAVGSFYLAALFKC